ncbi:MAG: general secretion pathway protein GspD [Planctomycetota bacterium]|nr:MAG: general secretion pathway protein GspD [Planctomycetota bacterium]
MWLAPALLSPMLMSAAVVDSAYGQAASPTRSVGDSTANPAADRVLAWLDYASEADDTGKAAQAFAHALRERQTLAAPNAAIETRLKEVEAALLNKGVRRQQVIDALNNIPAAAVQTAGAQAGANGSDSVAPGVYDPAADTTETRAASSEGNPVAPAGVPSGITGEQLYRQGLELLSRGDREGAMEQFKQAWQYAGEMDPAIRNQLKDKLSSMQTVQLVSAPRPAGPAAQVDADELAARQRLMAEITGEIAAAEAHRETEPEVVAERLQTLRVRVSQANLDANARKQMLTIVDRAIAAHQVFMTQNRAAIDQNRRNREITEQIAMEEEQKFKIDQQIASLVETYNDLMDKGDFLAAETVAKQVGELDRNSTIAALLISNARNARRIGEYEEIRRARQDIFIDAMNDVDRAALGCAVTDAQPLIWGDVERWQDLTRSRARIVPESEQGMSEAERAIWERLRSPVLVDFKNRPLNEVAKVLSDVSGVLIHIDEASLAAEGYTPEMPVTLSLPSQIQLRSALNLLLNPHNLDYQIRNEVLIITSARNTAQANVQRTYSVKDLVLPIPNFIHDNDSGMAGAMRHAYEIASRGLVARTSPPPGIAANVQLASATLDPNAGVLGQMNNGLPGGNLPGQLGGLGALGGLGSSGGPIVGGGLLGGGAMNMAGPAPLGGGAAMADFDTLINLIQQTIEPDSWLANGGTSTILPYPSNLSIVVSAPQTTHEKIADLLESLRRLQDLQVTVEVKFITLTDNFFERIGVDFDLRIDDNVRQLPEDDQGPSTVVGLGSAFNPNSPIPFTPDFDIGLAQDSFTSAVPAFGGFDAASGASLGFAILSDLEMFFFMNAAQGDQRTQVLQAPRVTMFDGQFASITDTTSRPFVTSLIPVVGDFAVAQQPVITVLNEGTILNVQATVSQDKRFVRLTLNPSFTQIDRVDTFTFEGSETTRTTSDTTGTNILDPAGIITNQNQDQETVRQGTTVQQPSFATTSISTTVSVPDGGTILLGGIKRMREGRLERGVPILSKIPYLNRLFKNTAIGRETSTFMMTVTPRIIIQEEEEEKYGINP